MTPEETLLAAAADMAQHGHTKEFFFEPTDEGHLSDHWKTVPACALGSIARTTCRVVDGQLGSQNIDDLLASEAVARLARQVREDFPMRTRPAFDDYTAITQFNDHADTTGEDVILAMKKAAHGG